MCLVGSCVHLNEPIFSISQTSAVTIPPVRRRRRLIWLGILAALAFFPFLGSRDIAASHEARVAQTAREMAQVGSPWNARWTPVAPVVLKRRMGMVRLEPDESAPPILVNPWMVPLLKGEIRLQKPPLAYWCTAVLYCLLGFSEAATRLAPALLGFCSTFLIYDLARMLLGRRRAWFAGLIWVSTQVIPDQFRLAMADPYLAFFSLLCIWAWVRVAMKNVSRSGPDLSAATSSLPTLLILYFSLALGLLAKGPPLFVHVVAAIALFHFCYRRKIPGQVPGHAIGLTLLLLVALPWPIYVMRHVPNAVELWRYESVGELSDNVENARAWWFYLPNLPVIALPWLIVWAASWVRVLRCHRIPMVRIGNPSRAPVRYVLLWPKRTRLFGALWLGLMVIFFSIVHLKKTPYLLPDMPAQTLLMAQGVGGILAGARKDRMKGNCPIIIGGQGLIGLGIAVALPFFIYTYSPAKGMGEFLAGIAILAAGYALWAARRHMLRGWMLPQAVTYVLIIIIFSRFIITPQENSRSAKAIASELAKDAAQPGHTLLMGRLPEEVAVYLPLNERYEPAASHVLIVSDDQDGVLARRRGARNLTDRALDPLAFANWFPDARVLFVDRVPMKSAPGDTRWKVYELTLERKFYAFGSR